MTAEFFMRLSVGILICGVVPACLVYLIIHHLEITWINIFLVSGLESLFVFLAWELGKWVRESWNE